MKIATKLYYFKNGEMRLFGNYEDTYDILNISIPIKRWYRKNPYAKRIDKNLICQDYRIDQQRLRNQRNVYSEAYIEILYMTDVEEKHLNNLIKRLEENREYPIVWEDNCGNVHYEKKEDDYKKKCFNCGNKINDGDNYCYNCGVKLNIEIECGNCGNKNNSGNKYCNYCGKKL